MGEGVCRRNPADPRHVAQNARDIADPPWLGLYQGTLFHPMRGAKLVESSFLVLGGIVSSIEPIIPIHVERPFPHIEDDDVYEDED